MTGLDYNVLKTEMLIEGRIVDALGFGEWLCAAHYQPVIQKSGFLNKHLMQFTKQFRQNQPSLVDITDYTVS